MVGFRGAVRGTAERVLSALRVPDAGRRWNRRAVAILTYHNVVPDDAPPIGDRGLHLSRARFAQQLDRLSRTHDVVSLGEIEQPYSGPRPRAVITFDDAYRGALEYGLPEVTRRRMTATIFVAPGLLGDKAFWWDLLATEGSVSAEIRDRALRSLRGRQEDILGEMADRMADPESLPPYLRSATESELRRATEAHDILLGSHTWSHPNLVELDDGAVRGEFERSWQWLTARFSTVAPWLAYPYGLASERVAATARGTFMGALELTGRVAPSVLDAGARHRLPRINIPSGISLIGFDLRLSGFSRPRLSGKPRQEGSAR